MGGNKNIFLSSYMVICSIKALINELYSKCYPRIQKCLIRKCGIAVWLAKAGDNDRHI